MISNIVHYINAALRLLRSSPWLLALPVAAVYFLFSYVITAHFQASLSTYYTLLTDAFLHGRTNVLPTTATYDLSFFQNKWYLYWGPSPVLFILPFFLIQGPLASDVFYTLVAALFNIILFAFLVKEFIVYTKLVVPDWIIWIIITHFALASPNFFLALTGTIWYTSQTIAILYLLASLLLFFKFLNKQQIVLLCLSLVFFHLAWLARAPLAVYGIIFLYPLTLKHFYYKKILILLVLISFLLSASYYAWYNVDRFHSPFENGTRYQLADPRYEQDSKAGHFLDIKNIPHNIWVYFFNTPFSLQSPFLRFDPEGTSVLVMYPLVALYIFSLFMRKNEYVQKLFFFLYAVIGVILIFLMLFFGTGWRQFGSRYVFDIIPPLFLCSLPVLNRLPLVVNCAVLFFGIFINVFGVLIYFSQKF